MEEISQNKKYLDIIQAARTLFWKHGFKRVSIEEICREAKTSKMTFYKFFANKLELAKAVFDFVVDDSVSTFKTILRETTSASELIGQMLQMKKEGIHEISKEFITDFYTNPELGLKDYIEEKTRTVWAEMIGDFKLAQERGILRNDLNIEFFVYFTRKFSDLLNDPYLNKIYPNPQDLIMELTRFSAYGISPH
ncbi:MAG: TetR/AcrR family transcriptional regulator [Bacteroidota bacterium]|nr:TetR/AcrR family transcriptional regulator [Bacteroidota bacterium]